MTPKGRGKRGKPPEPAPSTTALAGMPRFSLRKLVAVQRRLARVADAFSAGQLAIMSYALGVLSAERIAAGERLDDDGAVEPEPELGGESREQLEALIEQLDEELCTLLHDGDEVGAHGPEEHLALARSRRDASGGLDGRAPLDVAIEVLQSERAAAHMAGCRYEREFPAIDPEDCPRCSEVGPEKAPHDPPGEGPVELWREWCSRDITSTDDGWATFTNRVHAMLARRGITPP